MLHLQSFPLMFVARCAQSNYLDRMLLNLEVVNISSQYKDRETFSLPIFLICEFPQNKYNLEALIEWVHYGLTDFIF